LKYKIYSTQYAAKLAILSSLLELFRGETHPLQILQQLLAPRS